MTLEDFFTLTEMKDGLTAPSRVHELVAVMQQEKDGNVKNVGDATRQWAAVASTIAATENKDCLDLFIRLDGLWFFDKWLKDAQKYGNDTADGFVEESLTALLRALEKLQIDKERSVSSGIWISVNNLLGHSSSRVQDRARALFDSWKHGSASNASHQDVQNVEAFCDASAITSNRNGGTEYTAVDVPLPKGNMDAESNAAETARDGILLSKSSNSFQSEEVKEQIQTSRNSEDPSPDPLSMSILSNAVQRSTSLKEKFLISAVDGTPLTETSSFSIPRVQNTESELDASKNPSCFSDASDMIVSPCKVEPGVTSPGADTIIAKENLAEHVLQNNVHVKESHSGLNSSVSGDVGKSISPPKAVADDGGSDTHPSKHVLESVAKDDCSSDTMPNSPDSDRRSEKSEDAGTPLSRMVDIGADEEDDREHSSDGADNLREFTRTVMDTHSSDPMNQKRSDMQIEYGIDDALEVARQVAQEVEREVVEEPSCSSSSDKAMANDIGQPDSPDSINAKRDMQMEVPQEDVSTGKNLSADGSTAQEGRLISPNNVEAENSTHELETSLVTEVAPEAEVNTEKGLCDFDLNQEVCSDDMEHIVNPISTPISVVSASRPAAASGSPSGPLQFEGILGWKGSAATSAFRPASLRKTSDGEKTPEMGGTSNSSKKRQDSLDIDLNVAEDGDEKVMDLMLERSFPVSSGLHSGESSLEVGPRRSERPNLDLNQISDEGDAPPSSSRMEGKLFYPRNGNRSPSPASSSSSMQPSLRNFDLNDRPLLHNDSSDPAFYLGKQNINAFGGYKPGDPVISIMGARVEVSSRSEVSRKDFVLQNPSLPNGKTLDPVMDANLARVGGVLGIPAVSYTHSPVFGYNGLTTAPTMAISSAVYGPSASIPCMVDARVAPVGPHILSSSSPVQPYSQPSFIMSMCGVPPSLNGVGPSRPNFDLNSGFPSDGGSSGGFRHVFMPGQSRSIEDQLRVNAQPPSSSGVGSKRREPDSGWEPYSLPYKHPQPPWR